MKLWVLAICCWANGIDNCRNSYHLPEPPGIGITICHLRNSSVSWVQHRERTIIWCFHHCPAWHAPSSQDLCHAFIIWVFLLHLKKFKLLIFGFQTYLSSLPSYSSRTCHNTLPICFSHKHTFVSLFLLIIVLAISDLTSCYLFLTQE